METQGVTEYAGPDWPNKPDELFKKRNGWTDRLTSRMSVRTKAGFLGTSRPAARDGRGFRPLEIYCVGVAAAVFSLLSGQDCGSEKPETPSVAAASKPIPTPLPDLFVSTVRPVLVSKCAPCHEPGGKLYEKLPFDDAGVVAAHAPGILRRLKGEDRAAVEKWVASLPPKNTTP